ncbi:MAG: addiction module protein [Sulfurimonas sp.]|uniref:addiction module protein n=1 Tax=Sulfurimonas sp. TaxID=2022749 RepID=UPI002604525A|nr:addiction module protein [Sulfurimonas sp.]MDD5372028.1 addiction module protein [Sulfurimonas sp.]
MLEALDLHKMSISDKFLMMEELWEDLSQNASANGFSPQWHYDELMKRERKVQDGELKFSALSEAKKRLKNSIHEN